MKNGDADFRSDVSYGVRLWQRRRTGGQRRITRFWRVQSEPIMDLAVARAIHVLAIVLWIGGVGFVTTVLFPAVRRTRPPEDRLAAFAGFEAAFAWQARISVALAGLSGFYMTARLDAWVRFASPQFWWMHAMVCLWLVFAVMLFIVEPLILHRRMAQAIQQPNSARLFDRMERFHQIMLAVSLVTVFGAVAGSHGLF